MFKFDILPSREYEKSGIDAIPRPYILVEEEATGLLLSIIFSIS
jgi:mannuronan 5-epimerase